MKSFDNIKLTTVNIVLILTISSIFLLSNFTVSCFAQSQKNDIELKFIKETDSIKSTDLYFNILKIWNNTTKPIVGNLKFNGPDKWTIISFPTDQTILVPGDTITVPLRVSPIANALGGISYIIGATFRSSQKLVTTSAYVTLPSKAKWDFSVNKDNIYFTKHNPNTTFEIRLSNKGNTNELIKLDLEAGKLLKFQDNPDNSFFQFVNLPAFKDTIVFHTVSTQERLNYTEKMRYENNWRESSVKVTASTEQIQKSSAIQIHTLNSIFVNQRAEASSPLNFDYDVYNLMSNQPLQQNLKVYGTILFPKNRELQYYAGLQNFNFAQGINSINLDQQLLYTLRYADMRNEIYLGYNVNGESLHSINGRGITGRYRLNLQNSINYTFIQNPYTNSFGESLGYNTSLRGVALNFGVTNENRVDGNYSATSGSFGMGFSLFKHHSFTFQFLGSKSKFNNVQSNDTSLLGYSYKFNYNIQYKKFSFSVSSLNSEHNFIQNSGLQQSYLDSRYVISDKVTLSLYGNHQKYAISRYPYNFHNPINYNSNDNLRLATAFYIGNVVYQFGPNYLSSVRQNYNSINGYKSEYITYQPGLWCAAGIKLGGYSTLTPNITVSNLRFYYKTNDPNGLNYSFDRNIYYSAGVNFYNNVWRVNAYYTSGSATDLYRSVLVDSKPSTTSSIQFRPSYENFFFNRKVKLSAYMNYAYYMPEGRENTSYNLRYDQYFKNGWNMSLSGFMYSNTRVDNTLGRISTKDVNMFIGISKSFNIQQPRLKYYDYKSVFFNDLDGNKIKSDNEPPVTDIIVNIQKDRNVSSSESYISEIKLITDEKGSVAVENLPKDNYLMTFTPLTNLQNLYFLNGSEQLYLNDKTRTVYIPLAESYRIKGKINLVRDPNSTEGKINLDGIRITATGSKAETYSVLTDNFGAFVLSVPKADKYKVHVNNVFGEQFSIEADEALVQFTQNKAVSLDFTFIERAREIQFDGGELFKFNSLTSDSASAVNTEGDVIDVLAKETSKNYAIQLIATKTYKDPTFFKTKYNLKSDVLVQKKDGLYKYYTGDFPTIDEAQKAITKSHLQGNAVEVDQSKLKSSITISRTHIIPVPLTEQKGLNRASIPVKAEQTTQNSSVNTRESISSINEVVPAYQQLIKPVVIDSSYSNHPYSTSQEVSGTGNLISSNEFVPDKIQPNQLGNLTDRAAAKPTLTKIDTFAASKKKPIAVAIVPRQSSASTNVIKEDINVVPPMSDVVNQKNNSNSVVTTKLGTAKNTQPVLSEPISIRTNSTETPVLLNTGANKAKPVGKLKNEVNEQLVDVEAKMDRSNQMYTIQLDATWNFIDPKSYKDKYNLPFDVICIKRNGVRKYYAGKYLSKADATTDIARYGMAGYIVKIEESREDNEINVKK